jgi:hypothetical protein
VLHALPDADLEGALGEWRKYRRAKHLVDVHWVDVLYRAYLTGIVALVALVVASDAIGDTPVDRAGIRDVLHHGPGWIGGIAALAIAMGLRSGSRGGPLALERADVRHILLAPVDRTSALRAPAIRQLRFSLFLGAVAGAVAGQLAEHRLPGSTAAWVATGALGGLTAAGLGAGSAYVAGGLRLPRWITSLIGVGLVAAAVLDGTGVTSWSPTESFGRLLLWPLHFDPLGLVWVVVAAVLVGLGMVFVGAVSLESAERRSTLVGQLRFAATMQDLRTVIVLRRQLALELPRARPWVRIRVRGSGRMPVFVRGLRGVLRWPAARVARLGLLAIVAGAALRGAWSGTTPLVLVAGFAMFIAGLDGVESLAQEVDHPSRRDASPREAGEIHFGHIPVSLIVLLVTGGIAAGVAAIPGTGAVPGGVAAVLALPLALGGASGALVSVLGFQGTGSATADTLAVIQPEAQGIRLAFRTVWPPALGVIGALPVLAARAAVDDGRSGPGAAAAALAGVAALFVLVSGWVRVRDRIAEWWRGQMEQAFPKRSET